MLNDDGLFIQYIEVSILQKVSPDPNNVLMLSIKCPCTNLKLHSRHIVYQFIILAAPLGL